MIMGDLYDTIDERFNKNDMVKSLNDGKVKKYSGHLTLINECYGYDSLNKDVILYDHGEYAEVVEKGIDHEAIAWKAHMKNVMDTCKRLNCTPSELLKMDYLKELKQ